MSTKARNEEPSEGAEAEAGAGASSPEDALPPREPGDAEAQAADDADAQPADGADAQPADDADAQPADDADPGSSPGSEVEVTGEAVVAGAAEPASGMEPGERPRAFLKGAVFGLILLVPLTALAVYVLGRLGIGDPEASYYNIIAFAAVFAGLPAMITAGGVGRAAASALVRPGERGGPAACTRVAMIDTALTGIGLVLLTVVPLGEVPTEVGTWVWIIVLGASTGALGGFVLGLWVGYGSSDPRP